MALPRLNGSALVVLMLATAACMPPNTVRITADDPAAVDVSQLWEEPADLASRDVFHGPGGQALIPVASTTFTFVKADQAGYSPGYDVRGPDGMSWSVKLGPEAQSEVVVSRLLWAIGYHQPATYLLERWTMEGAQGGPQPTGRFRAEPSNHKVVADWSWYENEFLHTRPFKGLVVVNVLLNNWDWKTSNNKVYEVRTPEGARRVYVVRDLGASLGKTSYPKLLSWLPMRGLGQGSRNDVEDFEAQGFIKRVEGERVDFVYRGIHQSLIGTVSKSDVVWATRLLARLSDAQWNDAFRAAAFPPEVGGRYIAKIKSKIAEGLKLAEG